MVFGSWSWYVDRHRYGDFKLNVLWFFCDHVRWTTLRRLISARILYQHSIGLGVLLPKVNRNKVFVKVYIITNPARFHSNPSHEALGKDDKGDVTRDDSQRRFLAQHRIKMLEQCCSLSKRCRNNVVTLCCAKKSSLQIVLCNITLKLLRHLPGDEKRICPNEIWVVADWNKGFWYTCTPVSSQ